MKCLFIFLLFPIFIYSQSNSLNKTLEANIINYYTKVHGKKYIDTMESGNSKDLKFRFSINSDMDLKENDYKIDSVILNSMGKDKISKIYESILFFISERSNYITDGFNIKVFTYRYKIKRKRSYSKFKYVLIVRIYT